MKSSDKIVGDFKKLPVVHPKQKIEKYVRKKINLTKKER